MRIPLVHRWDLSPAEAIELQKKWRQRVATTLVVGEVQRVAGVDVAFREGNCCAAVAVLGFPDLQVVEVGRAERPVEFPYIPGLLSFRETPTILAAMETLANEPDLIFADGHGLAHPRRFGIACHLGVLLGKPAIGCAKSVLCGRHGPLGAAVASFSYIRNGGEIIGAAVRTRPNALPVYISVGHNVDLATAI